MKYLLSISFFLSVHAVSFSAGAFYMERGDSTVPEKKDTIREYRKEGVTYTIGGGIEQHEMDTTLMVFQHYDLLDINGFRYRNIGNLGSAHFPILFMPESQFGFRSGYNQFDQYAFSRENIRHYNSKGPYSHLFFLIGLKNEQTFRVEHNQNIGSTFNFAFRYNRIASKGTYENQEAKHNNFAITTNYHSKSQKYDLNTLFIFNNANVLENGGVKDIFIFEEDTSFRQNALVGVELASANSRRRELFFELYQAFNEGKTIREKINDSLTIKKFFPTFTLYHAVDLDRDYHYFFDDNPDSSYYRSFYPDADSTGNRDAFNYFESRTVSNRIGLKKFFIRSVDSARVNYRNIVLEAEGEYAYHYLFESPLSTNSLNELNVHATVRSHPEIKEGLQYKFTGKYSFLDYTAKDVQLDGRFGYAFKKAGEIEAFASYQRMQPDWIFKKFISAGASWNLAFEKQSVFTTGLTYQFRLPKFNFRLTGEYHTVKNLAYWDANRLPAQSGDNLQIVVGEVGWLLWIKHFGWDNYVRVQYIPNSELLRFPLFWSIHSLFYERTLFKKHLLLKVGIDIKYNTNYDAYGYFPLTGQFYNQDIQKLKYYPVLDFFASIKIKTFRLFLKVDHLNRKMFKPDGYFDAYKYPAPNLSFKVGISWMFYDWVKENR